MKKLFYCLSLLLIHCSNCHAETLTILSFAENEDAANEEEVSDLATMTTLLEKERMNASFAITALFGDVAPDEEPAFVDILNEMKIDFAVFSSEKYSQKIETLKERLRQAKFSLLGANVINLEGKSPWNSTKESHIYHLGDIKVGLFGLSEPKGENNASGERCLCFLPYLETAKQKSKELKDAGADVIILFSDLSQSEERWIAHDVKDIDVIVGSAATGPVTWFENKVLIHRDERKGAYLGRIDLVIKKTLTWRGPSISIYPTWRMIHNIGVEPNEKIAAKIYHPKRLSLQH